MEPWLDGAPASADKGAGRRRPDGRGRLPGLHHREAALRHAETWRLLVDHEGAPGFNLALDEALLVSSAPPALRLYGWSPAALSLGYFQRLADVAAHRDAPAVVRRPTGGGAIHHFGELTYSFALDAKHPLVRGEIAESYRRIHRWIAAAMTELGVQAELRGPRPAASDRTGTGMCFHESSPVDLVWRGAKIAGAAQRRTGGRVLHHGSIKLAGGSPLEPGIDGIAAAAPHIDAQSFGPYLLAALERLESIRCEPAEPTSTELVHARARAEHFGSPAFLARR